MGSYWATEWLVLASRWEASIYGIPDSSAFDWSSILSTNSSGSQAVEPRWIADFIRRMFLRDLLIHNMEKEKESEELLAQESFYFEGASNEENLVG